MKIKRFVDFLNEHNDSNRSGYSDYNNRSGSGGQLDSRNTLGSRHDLQEYNLADAVIKKIKELPSDWVGKPMKFYTNKPESVIAGMKAVKDKSGNKGVIPGWHKLGLKNEKGNLDTRTELMDFSDYGIIYYAPSIAELYSAGVYTTNPNSVMDDINTSEDAIMEFSDIKYSSNISKFFVTPSEAIGGVLSGKIESNDIAFKDASRQNFKYNILFKTIQPLKNIDTSELVEGDLIYIDKQSLSSNNGLYKFTEGVLVKEQLNIELEWSASIDVYTISIQSINLTVEDGVAEVAGVVLQPIDELIEDGVVVDNKYQTKRGEKEVFYSTLAGRFYYYKGYTIELIDKDGLSSKISFGNRCLFTPASNL